MPRYWTVMLLMLLSGCGERATGPQEQSAAPGARTELPRPEPQTTADAAPQSVDLKILDYAGVQQLIASHRPKVVVMDAWSTSCLPCMKEFHNLVEIHHQYPGQVACVSLSLDYEGVGKPEDQRERVLKFLRKQNATFDNVLAREESDVIYGKLDLASVPAVFVYGQDGKLVKRFDNEDASAGEFTYQHVKDLVAKLVDEGQASKN